MKRWLRSRVKSSSPTQAVRFRSSASCHGRMGSDWVAFSSSISGLLSASPRNSSSGAAVYMNVVPTNTPPGFRTRLISASARDGFGQQWIAAPACTAANAPLVKGRRLASPRTSMRSGDPLSSASSSMNVRVCLSMFSL